MECSNSKAVHRHLFVEKALEGELESVNQNIASDLSKDIKNTHAGDRG